MKHLLSTAKALHRYAANLVLVAGLVLITALQLGWLTAVHVASINMAPTLAMNDRIMVRSWGPAPSAGDVVAYRSPFSDELLVGRIVATAGERVSLDENGLLVDGHAVADDAAPKPPGTEPPVAAAADSSCILSNSCPAAPAASAVVGLVETEAIGSHRYLTRKAGALAALHFPQNLVPDEHVFVLNDNRIDERDSRIFGAIPTAAVVGVASFVYYATGDSGIRWDRMTRRVS